MAKVRTEFVDTADGVELRITGTKINGKVLAECTNALLECAERNECFRDGYHLTDKCVETFARHNEAARCFAEAFGFKQVGRT